jgi:hypothetical protein
MTAGDRLKSLDPGQFPLIGPVVIEAAPINDFDRAKVAVSALRQPNFPVTAATDAPEQVVFGDKRRLKDVRAGNIPLCPWREISHEFQGFTRETEPLLTR